MEGDVRRKEQEERKLKVTHSPSTYSRQNWSSVRRINANEACTRRNRNSLRNPVNKVKRSIYITSTISIQANPNLTHENVMPSMKVSSKEMLRWRGGLKISKIVLHYLWMNLISSGNNVEWLYCFTFDLFDISSYNPSPKRNNFDRRYQSI